MKTPGTMVEKPSRDELEDVPLGQETNPEVHMKTYMLIVVCTSFAMTRTSF